jgi:phage regulator Rha-like protein
MNPFQELVVVTEGQPLASTEVIARGMKQQHASTIKLVRKHQAALEQFGRVRFEIRPFQTAGGIQQREIAMLNEQQAAILISLMKNSEQVVDFKVALIAEFYRMRDALQQRPQSLWQQMQALIAQEVESKVRASFGSRLMLERKRDIPYYRDEHDRLEMLIQPPLLQ